MVMLERWFRNCREAIFHSRKGRVSYPPGKAPGLLTGRLTAGGQMAAADASTPTRTVTTSRSTMARMFSSTRSSSPAAVELVVTTAPKRGVGNLRPQLLDPNLSVSVDESSCGGHLFAAGDTHIHKHPQCEHGNDNSVGRCEIYVDHVSDHRQGHRSRQADYRLPQRTDFANCGCLGPSLKDAHLLAR